MGKSAFYTATAKRLLEYYPFSQETIEAVAAFANQQIAFKTYRDFFASVGLPEVQLFSASEHRGVTVVDVRRKKEVRTIVMHLPMANPLDTNQLYQVATMAGVFTDARIIAFGNPNGGRFAFKQQNLSLLDKIGIATTLRLRPLVAAELAYLGEQGVKDAYFAGFSYGAVKALIAAKYTPQGMVSKVIAVEPISHRRSPFELLDDFKRTSQPLRRYVEATGLETFIKARADAATGNEFNAGLRRPINLAIGAMLSHISTSRLLRTVLRRHPGLKVSVAWGTASELVDTKKMNSILAHIQILYGSCIELVCDSIVLKGQKHAFANDVHLHAAIIHQAIASEIAQT